MYKVSLLLSLVISFIAGHVLVAPSVAIYLAFIYFLILNKEKEKTKVLISAKDLGVGGIEVSLITLLKKLDYDKFSVSLALEHKKGEFIEQIPSDVHIINYKLSHNKIINFFKRIKFLIFYTKAFDASITYTTYSLMASMCSLVASSNRTIFIHSDYSYICSIDDCHDFFARRSIDKYNHIVFVSEESKTNFCKIFPDLKRQCQVINNIVDYTYIEKMALQDVAFQKSKNEKLLVFVGRLDESSKKLGRIITVMHNLVPKNKKLRLLLVGDGPDRNKYEQLVKKYHLEKNVTFIGLQKNPYPYIKMADYIVLCSDYEGFPVVYHEAIILNIPIITTIDVNDESIKLQEHGFLVAKDPDKMSFQIADILNNDNVHFKSLNYEQINKMNLAKIEKIIRRS